MVKFILNIIFLSSVILSSCTYVSVPHKIKKEFDFCFDGQKTELNSIINTKGYYLIENIYEKPIYGEGNLLTRKQSFVLDTTYQYLLFFEDGTFVTGFFDFNEKRRKNEATNISLLFKELSEEPYGKAATSFKKWFKWGVYKLNKDTIKVQWITHPETFSPYWYASEVWYKVIDRNTIIEVFSKLLHTSESIKKEKNNKPAIFIQTEELPPSDCWLKMEDWFWCDKRKSNND